jgi:hypothetical protein
MQQSTQGMSHHGRTDGLITPSDYRARFRPGSRPTGVCTASPFSRAPIIMMRFQRLLHPNSTYIHACRILPVRIHTEPVGGPRARMRDPACLGERIAGQKRFTNTRDPFRYPVREGGYSIEICNAPFLSWHHTCMTCLTISFGG